jgi:hypothetical protein
MSTFDLSSQLAIGAPGAVASAAQPPPSGTSRYSSEEDAAAALVHLSGASSITVEQVEASVPPDLAAASSLVDQLSASANASVIPAAFGSLYTLLDPDTALALTSD